MSGFSLYLSLPAAMDLNLAWKKAAKLFSEPDPSFRTILRHYVFVKEAF